MRRFILRLSFFLIPVLVALLLLEIGLRSIPNDYAYKREYLDLHSNEIEILFLGNSHIYFDVNPAYLSRPSLNAAHVSQSLNYDLAILEKYQNSLKRLKYIVVPVDYFSLYSSLETGIEKWRVKNYSIYYDISLTNSFWNTLEVTSSNTPLNITRARKYIFLGESNIGINTLGFGTNYQSSKSKDLVATGLSAARAHTVKLNNPDIFNKNLESIRGMIEFTRQHNIKLLFITCPAYYSYRNNLDTVQLNNTIRIISNIAAGNSNTHYVNLMDEPSLTKEDFFDADHLNDIGARKFTMKLDSLINTIQ